MKKLYYSVLLVGILVSSLLYSRNLPPSISLEPGMFEQKQFCQHTGGIKQLKDKPLANAVRIRPYDVLKYDIYLDWFDMMSKQPKLDSNGFGYLTGEDIIWTGKNTITMRVMQDNVTAIELDAGNELIMQSVTVNGKKFEITPQPVNDILKIVPDLPVHKYDSLLIEIEYKHDGGLSQDNYGNYIYRGFFLYPKRLFLGQINVPPYDSAWVEERLAYTMSEPEEARYWMPCNDSPYDKAMETMTVKVPSGYSVASNGLMNKIDSTTDSRTYHWVGDEPISTYLIAATSSKFHEFSDTYKRLSNGENVPLKYFVWEKDYQGMAQDASGYNARWTFEQNVQQVECFSKYYGEYPFKKYGLVALIPFAYGGMEHQTLTSISRVWLRTNERGGLAHELAHQWLGDKVTCSSWNDIWMNEGGATFSEAIWAEYQSGRQGYNDNMLYFRKNYFDKGGANLPPIWGLPTDAIFADPDYILVYKKASWVYHMLRTSLGDSVFFPALRSYFNRFAYGTVSKDSIEKSFTMDVKNPPVPFNIYFKQWLMKPGHPLFDAVVDSRSGDNNKNNIDIFLRQIQETDTISSFFTVPVRVTLTGSAGETFIDTLLQNQREQHFQRTLSFMPVKIEIDTVFILCEVYSAITSVREVKDSETIVNSAVYPNPVIKGNTCKFITSFNSGNDNPEISLYNELGQFVKKIHSGYLPQSTYEFDFQTNDLLPGVYFIKISTKDNVIIKKLSLVE